MAFNQLAFFQSEDPHHMRMIGVRQSSATYDGGSLIAHHWLHWFSTGGGEQLSLKQHLPPSLQPPILSRLKQSNQ